MKNVEMELRYFEDDGLLDIMRKVNDALKQWGGYVGAHLQFVENGTGDCTQKYTLRLVLTDQEREIIEARKEKMK